MVCPVVNEEASMHRNAITPVISWVSAMHLSGIQSSRSATNSGLLNIGNNKFTDLTKLHGDNLIRRIQTFTQTGWKEKPITQFILAHQFHSLSREIDNTMQGYSLLLPYLLCKFDRNSCPKRSNAIDLSMVFCPVTCKAFCYLLQCSWPNKHKPNTTLIHAWTKWKISAWRFVFYLQTTQGDCITANLWKET